MYISECVCCDYSLHFTATVQTEDFMFVSEQLTFDSNDTSRTVSISAIGDDDDVEGNEMFTISLNSSAPNLAFRPATATVTITDLTSELYICTVLQTTDTLVLVSIPDIHSLPPSPSLPLPLSPTPSLPLPLSLSLFPSPSLSLSLSLLLPLSPSPSLPLSLSLFPSLSPSLTFSSQFWSSNTLNLNLFWWEAWLP